MDGDDYGVFPVSRWEILRQHFCVYTQLTCNVSTHQHSSRKRHSLPHGFSTEAWPWVILLGKMGSSPLFFKSLKIMMRESSHIHVLRNLTVTMYFYLAMVRSAKESIQFLFFFFFLSYNDLNGMNDTPLSAVL